MKRPPQPYPPRVAWGLVSLLVLLVGLTLGLVAVGQGNVWAAISPVLLVTLLYAIWKAPLRYPLFALMFCALTLETPYTPLALGKFRSPLAPVGGLLLANLNQVTGVEALHFTGLDCLIALLFLVAAWRQTIASRIDGQGQAPTASIMSLFAWTTLVTTAGVWAYGMVRGGSFSDSLWQMHKLLYVPLLFFLFQVGLRGPRDYAALARIVIAAALVRSVAAILIRAYIRLPSGVELPWATTHADSLLFACALAIVVALFLERPDRRRLMLCVVVLPLLIWGMIANTRRLVWVNVAGVLIAFALVTPWTPLKRKLARAALLALPFLLAYAAIGWHSRAPVFAPVQTVRSIIDPEADRSTEWREHENFNLVYTILDHPWLGSGFGHEYAERWGLADISGAFRQYRFNPHNSVLGLWAFAGLIGFSAIWMLLVVAVFLAVRSYYRAPEPGDRAAALATLGAIIVYISQGYGDIGLTEWAAAFTMGPTLAVVGKLAVVTGAWPARRELGSRRLVQGTVVTPGVVPLFPGPGHPHP